jgi:hypothetical protein
LLAVLRLAVQGEYLSGDIMTNIFIRGPMTYTNKFQKLADDACLCVEGVLPKQVDELIEEGAIALDRRAREEHERDHIEGSLNISREKLKMIIESKVENLETVILC